MATEHPLLPDTLPEEADRLDEPSPTHSPASGPAAPTSVAFRIVVHVIDCFALAGFGLCPTEYSLLVVTEIAARRSRRRR